MGNIDQVTKDMDVMGSDGESVGTVDHVEDGRLKLKRKDPEAGGVHHYIPSDWIDSVSGNEVTLNKPADEVMSEWEEDDEDTSTSAASS